MTPTFNHDAEEISESIGLTKEEFKQAVEQALKLARTIAEAYMLEEPKEFLLLEIAREFSMKPFDPFKFSVLLGCFARILSDCFEDYVFTFTSETEGGVANA